MFGREINFQLFQTFLVERDCFKNRRLKHISHFFVHNMGVLVYFICIMRSKMFYPYAFKGIIQIFFGGNVKSQPYWGRTDIIFYFFSLLLFNLGKIKDKHLNNLPFCCFHRLQGFHLSQCSWTFFLKFLNPIG